MLSKKAVHRHCQTYGTFTSIDGPAEKEVNSDKGSPSKQLGY